VRPRAGSDASDSAWHPVGRLPPLGFDHRKIVAKAVERLRAKLCYSTVGFQLLPTRFTLSELQAVYEVILGKPLDKRNFRRKMLSLSLLAPAGETKGHHRPARLYSFKIKENLIIDGLIRP
jgi:8-oxo-dGTP diphosphatase